MDFAFSEEQEMLRSGAKQFLDSKFPAEKVVEIAESDDRSLDTFAWREIAELGWTGLSVPEDQGGSGMGFLEETVLFETTGHALYPGPFFTTVGLALPLLKGDALEGVVSGEAAATVAWLEDGPGLALNSLDELGTKAEKSDGSWTLTGTKDLVAGTEDGGAVAVVARASEGVGVWVVDAGADGVEIQQMSTMDSTRPLARITLSGASAEELVAPGDADDILNKVRLRALVALAVEAVGVSQKAFDLASAHAKERQQFDKPIGTYQAVSHQIADMFVETELARSVAYWAAWCVAEGDDQAEAAAAAAKSIASEAAVRSCERSIQVHGGIGFTWEHVLHRYYKRAQWIASFEGFPATHRKTVASALLDG
jgi:alkylation response protein AidB-like acyl-CoA dehydrogenase